MITSPSSPSSPSPPNVPSFPTTHKRLKLYEGKDKRWSLQEEIAKTLDIPLQTWFLFGTVNLHSVINSTSILDVWPDIKKSRLFEGPTHAALNVLTQLDIQENDMIERSRCFVSVLGFINFTLSREWVARSIHKMIKDGIETWAPKLSKKRAIIYFWSRNIAKKMSMGHLRSTVIGESLARMLEYSRVEVIRRFHEGDDLDIKSKMMMTEFLLERFPNGEVNDQAIGEPEGKSLYDPYISKTLDLLRGKGLTIDGEGVIIAGRKLPLADLTALWHALDMVKAGWIVHVTDLGKRDYIPVLINAAKRAGCIERYLYLESCPNGTFTVKDARYMIDQNILPTLAHATSWDKSIPRKVNVFMWRLSLD
ncbi:anticodon-binding aminoacyl-tRNA synthetase, class 1a [Tanacetum coccineum]